MNLIDLTTDLEVDFFQGIQKSKVVESTEDLLALSTAWYRLRQSRITDPTLYIGVSRLMDAELLTYVTDEDRKHAADIRDFYSKKIMIWKLKNLPFSRFRNDLNEFIHSDGKKFKEDMCPLAYRLPEFYEYDIEREKLVSTYNTTVKQERLFGKQTLSLVKTFDVKRGSSKKKEYWFTNEHNDLVQLSVDTSNKLLPLMDWYVSNPFPLDGHFLKRATEGKEYLVVDKFKFS
jgi:hypothetical protein